MSQQENFDETRIEDSNDKTQDTSEDNSARFRDHLPPILGIADPFHIETEEELRSPPSFSANAITAPPHPRPAKHHYGRPNKKLARVVVIESQGITHIESDCGGFCEIKVWVGAENSIPAAGEEPVLIIKHEGTAAAIEFETKHALQRKNSPLSNFRKFLYEYPPTDFPATAKGFFLNQMIVTVGTGTAARELFKKTGTHELEGIEFRLWLK